MRCFLYRNRRFIVFYTSWYSCLDKKELDRDSNGIAIIDVRILSNNRLYLIQSCRGIIEETGEYQNFDLKRFVNYETSPPSVNQWDMTVGSTLVADIYDKKMRAFMSNKYKGFDIFTLLSNPSDENKFNTSIMTDAENQVKLLFNFTNTEDIYNKNETKEIALKQAIITLTVRLISAMLRDSPTNEIVLSELVDIICDPELTNKDIISEIIVHHLSTLSADVKAQIDEIISITNVKLAYNQIISVLETRESVKDITIAVQKAVDILANHEIDFCKNDATAYLSTFGAMLTEELIVKREDGKITEKFVNESLRKISVSSNEISNNVDFYIESIETLNKGLVDSLQQLNNKWFSNKDLYDAKYSCYLEAIKESYWRGYQKHRIEHRDLKSNIEKPQLNIPVNF